ncbi:hypothetical protein OH802_20950 [Nocardioides sp. NBC_00850]|uniref:hypothetical protein n=1 Tax=Nocardioides sp. NBC_00850 TaxID=2976001 RepID=UPI0038674ECD|nr:hypothetical protein OH802_20950 [Nocardioides sp. NBC_00850]
MGRHRHHHSDDPGSPAPKLITEGIVAATRNGSVTVDVAAANGGNAALTKTDERIVTDNSGTIEPVKVTAPMNTPMKTSALWTPRRPARPRALRYVAPPQLRLEGRTGCGHLERRGEMNAAEVGVRSSDVHHPRRAGADPGDLRHPSRGSSSQVTEDAPSSTRLSR